MNINTKFDNGDVLSLPAQTRFGFLLAAGHRVCEGMFALFAKKEDPPVVTLGGIWTRHGYDRLEGGQQVSLQDLDDCLPP